MNVLGPIDARLRVLGSAPVATFNVKSEKVDHQKFQTVIVC